MNDRTNLSPFVAELIEQGLIEEEAADALNRVPSEALQRNLFQEYRHDKKAEIPERVAQFLKTFDAETLAPLLKTASFAPTPLTMGQNVRLMGQETGQKRRYARLVSVGAVLGILLGGVRSVPVIRHELSANELATLPSTFRLSPEVSGFRAERLGMVRWRLQWQRFGDGDRYSVYSVIPHIHQAPRQETLRPISQTDWIWTPSHGLSQPRQFIFVRAVNASGQILASSDAIEINLK